MNLDWCLEIVQKEPLHRIVSASSPSPHSRVTRQHTNAQASAVPPDLVHDIDTAGLLSPSSRLTVPIKVYHAALLPSYLCLVLLLSNATDISSPHSPHSPIMKISISMTAASIASVKVRIILHQIQLTPLS